MKAHSLADARRIDEFEPSSARSSLAPIPLVFFPFFFFFFFFFFPVFPSG